MIGLWATIPLYGDRTVSGPVIGFASDVTAHTMGDAPRELCAVVEVIDPDYPDLTVWVQPLESITTSLVGSVAA